VRHTLSARPHALPGHVFTRHPPGKAQALGPGASSILASMGAPEAPGPCRMSSANTFNMTGLVCGPGSGPKIAAGLAWGWQTEHMRDRACPGGSGLSVLARPLSLHRFLLLERDTEDVPGVLPENPVHCPLVSDASGGQMFSAGHSCGTGPHPSAFPGNGPWGSTGVTCSAWVQVSL
jgi:hypothetical protein